MTVTAPAKTSKIAALFHALSDETRLGIVQRLTKGERCVCDLTDALDSAQSRLSWHLKVLKEAGIVLDRKQGRSVYYALNPEAFADMGEVVSGLEEMATKSSSSKCCS